MNEATATIDLLVEGLDSGKLTGWGADKARDLIKFYDKKRRWASDKQEAFARSLLTPKERATVELGDLSGVMDMFRSAAMHKKFPAIMLVTNAGKALSATKGMTDPEPLVMQEIILSHGQPLVLRVAGPKSKYAGSLTVTDGGPYGNNTWYGRITPEGVFEQTFRKLPAMADVCDTLRALADDPVGVVSMCGKITNSCCFCNRELSDDTSRKLGFGPVCAKNHGLKWSKSEAEGGGS